jgi:hypothetical protein
MWKTGRFDREAAVEEVLDIAIALLRLSDLEGRAGAVEGRFEDSEPAVERAGWGRTDLSLRDSAGSFMIDSG